MTSVFIGFKSQEVYIQSGNDIYVYEGVFNKNTSFIDIMYGLKYVETIGDQ